MKRIISFLLTITLILCLVPTTVFANNSFSPADIIGSWYGQYTGNFDVINVERYMNMTITDCDQNGNFTGMASVTTVENQGYDNQWIKYYFNGKIDFSNNYFIMQGTKKIGSDTSGEWQMVPFIGGLMNNQDNEIYVSGIVNNEYEKKFHFSKTSEWAKDEITEANINNLIPETMKNKDLSKPITRAEFAAVANQLYEKLVGKETQIVPSTFLDIANNPDEESIKKAHSLNITVGFSDTEFGPSLLITREQLATMLCRTIKKFKFADWTFATDANYQLDISGTIPFADDAFIADYAKPSVYYMTKMGIIKGFENNIFAPKATTDEQVANNYAIATREQAIVMALRIYKSINNFFN